MSHQENVSPKGSDIMETNKIGSHELRVREKKVTAIKAEKTVDFEKVEVVCVPSKPFRMVAIGNLKDFLKE